MKFLIVSAMLMFGLVTYADNAGVNLGSQVDCSISDKPAINWIEETTVVETEDEVKLKIVTSVGFCRDGERVARKLVVPFVHVWEENGFDANVGYKLEMLTETSALVEISFKKSTLFAERETREFTYAFHDRGLFKNMYTQFKWHVTLRLVEGTVELSYQPLFQ